VWRRALVVWVLLVGLAILNGIVRAAGLSPRLGAAAGHLVSSVVLADLIALTAWVTTRGSGRAPPAGRGRSASCGCH
jgi:fumarate reductase subunit D